MRTIIVRDRRARVVSVAFPAALLMRISHGTVPGAPDQSLPVQTTTAHYVFHHPEGDRIEPERQEVYHEWLARQLGPSLDRRIAHDKYRDRSASASNRRVRLWRKEPSRVLRRRVGVLRQIPHLHPPRIGSELVPCVEVRGEIRT